MRARIPPTSRLHRRLRCEHLEDRRLLAVIAIGAQEFADDVVIEFDEVESDTVSGEPLVLERDVNGETVTITLGPDGNIYPAISGSGGFPLDTGAIR